MDFGFDRQSAHKVGFVGEHYVIITFDGVEAGDGGYPDKADKQHRQGDYPHQHPQKAVVSEQEIHIDGKNDPREKENADQREHKPCKGLELVFHAFA